MKVRVVFAAVAAAVLSVATLVGLDAFEPDRPRTCVDGWAPPSIGITGACLHHGGVKPKERGRSFAWNTAVVVAFISYLGLSGTARRTLREIKLLNAANSPGVKDQTCPSCGSRMRLRTVRRGTRKGSKFWRCSAYPRCKAIIRLTK